MPGYGGSGLAVLLYENKQTFAWQGETVAVGETSQAFELRRTRGAAYPFGLSVEVAFAAAPGTFEVDVLTSDTDQLSHFVELATIITVNASNVGRVELPAIWAKYVALYLKTLTNAVAVTGQITR